MYKLLNGDLISVDNGASDREIRHQLGELLNISPHRIRFVDDKESKATNEQKANEEKANEETKDKTFRHVLVMEKDHVRMPIQDLNTLSEYHFLKRCNNVPILRKCLDICREHEYGEECVKMWLSLLQNPHPLVVDHLLAIPELHTRDFYRTLSGNPSERVVNWLIDEHPERIHLPLFLCNTNLRAIEYMMTHIYPGGVYATQFDHFVRKVVSTDEQIEWLYRRLVPFGMFTELKLTQDLCLNSSDAAARAFMRRYPTPEKAYEECMIPETTIRVLPRSYSEEMVPYYLYYLEQGEKRYANAGDWKTIYYILDFAASHPHPSIVEWWKRNVGKNGDMSKHNIYSNPSDEMVNWLNNQPFCCFDLFAFNPNPRALDMCLRAWRKGWPGDEIIFEQFAMGGMQPRAVMFLFNEYPNECRLILDRARNESGKWRPYGINELAPLDDWEWEWEWEEC